MERGGRGIGREWREEMEEKRDWKGMERGGRRKRDWRGMERGGRRNRDWNE